MMLVTAEGLAKKYGEKIVLTRCRFHIAQGELVSIVGPSGEGKSTIARTLCGTVMPDEGGILFDGDPLHLKSGLYDPRLRRSIQLVPQQPYASLDPLQNIGDAIAEPLLFHKLVANKAEARAQVIQWLEKVSLPPELLGRRPGELSGGQAQRALIARSLTVRPRLLIADEATSMLDISSQAQIVKIFRQLAEQEGLSVLLISHDRPLVETISDRVYQLSAGELTEI